MTAQVDVRAIERTLTETYGINACPDASGEATQVYTDAHTGAVIVQDNGAVSHVLWDRTGGVSHETEIKQAVDEDGAVRAVVGYLRRREIADTAARLRDMLAEYVPSATVDYRAERAVVALRHLERDIANVRIDTDPLP